MKTLKQLEFRTRRGGRYTEKALVILAGKLLRQAGAHVQRIEDKLTPGIPDMNVCSNGNEAWVEFKQCHKPSKPTGEARIKFQPHQLPWMNMRIRSGGKCYVFARIGATAYLFGAEQIKSGIFELPEKNLKRMSLYSGTVPKTVTKLMEIMNEQL